MTQPAQAVILFFTSNHAFHAEKLFKKEGIACKLVPVPRHLSSDCGVCARIDRTHMEKVREILITSKLETQGIHEI